MFTTFIPGQISTKDLHQILLGSIGPRPIAFASTVDRDGNHNLAPFSFFNVFSAAPPVLIFSPARRVRGNTTKHTLENVYEVPEVVINVVTYSIVEQMNLASSEYDRGVNEFVKAGFTPLDSDLVAPKRVAESPIQMECKVIEIKPLATTGGAGQLIFAQVLKIHVHENVLDERQKIDQVQLDLVGRLGGDWYSRADKDALFLVQKPGFKKGIGFDGMPEEVLCSKWLTGNELGKLGMIEKLPEITEINQFKLENKDKIEMASEADRHKAAAAYLVNQDILSAWKVLLC